VERYTKKEENMAHFKFTVIGAGSTYTPELVEGLALWKDKLPVDEITLCDVDENRLSIMEGFTKRYASNLGLKVKITSTTNRLKAIENATFVNTQIRVGGNEARVLDEKIPMSYGLIGQETTGAGGFAKALRTIPVMLDIAKDVEKVAPEAWIVNYTNPTGLVAEAVNRYTNAKIAGFCSGGIFPKMWANRGLGLAYKQVRYDYIGLNHMNFISNIKIDGRLATEEEFLSIAAQNKDIDLELVKLLGCIPSPYLQYYYHTSQRLTKLQNSKLTRGESVQELEKEIYEAYANPLINTKPEALEKRGGGGYSEVAMGFLNAIYNDEDTWMIVNVPNQGAISFLPNEAVIETGCLVNKAGIQPLKVSTVPNMVYGLIAAVKNYETLAVEAAVEGSRAKAKQALLAHPLVREYDLIEPLLNDLLEQNKRYLPQFYRGE
jgi:6-phospho-beta-glucosidase